MHCHMVQPDTLGNIGTPQCDTADPTTQQQLKQTLRPEMEYKKELNALNHILTEALHQSPSMCNPRAAIQMRAQRTQLTFSPTIPTNQMFEGPPVTPLGIDHRIVKLPVPTLPNPLPAPPPKRFHRSFIEQFRTELSPWQRPLFGPIQQLQPTARLRETSQNNLPLLLVSDASVQKNKQSSFAWIITHDTTILWKGVGLAPGHAEDIYSGRAEAFGLLAGLLFIQRYIESYDPQQFNDSPLTCFCDNAGVITNVSELMTAIHRRPNATTNDDRDVYLAISDAIARCNPLQIQLSHVKGHQDKDPKRKLTLPEQLNIECDKQAKMYARSATQSSTALGNPAIPVTQPHLFIAGKLICRKVIPHLRQTTSAQPYRRYLKKKFQWTEHDINMIHWEVLESALKSFPSEDQRRLILFINNKLPLRDSKVHPHHGSKLCPSCQREHETTEHFLRCQHPIRVAQFRTLKESLTKMTQKLRLQPYFFTTMWLGLTAYRNDLAYPLIMDDIPHQLQASIQTQTQLGWGQLYQGRLGVAWAQAIDALHPNLAPSGTQVMISMLQLVWTYV